MRAAIILGSVAVLVCGSLASAQGLRGRIEDHTFTGPITGRPVNYRIYLPQGYDAGVRRYPVIYHLHGLGGSSDGPSNTRVAPSFEDAQDAGVIGPVIIVFPDGYEDSFWADSIGGDKPAETDVARQLLPYIDANYRTIGTPASRAVEGFSMGGFGAAKFYSKFPGLFAACVVYDGAMVSWAGMTATFPDVATGVFGDDQMYYDEFSPWRWMSQNAAAVQAEAPVRLAVGILTSQNRAFRTYLTNLGVSVDYNETGCGHDLGCILDAEGIESAAYIAANIQTEASLCGADFNGDGVVNSQDFFGFITAFFAEGPRADVDGDGRVTSQDYFDYLTEFFAGC